MIGGGVDAEEVWRRRRWEAGWWLALAVMEGVGGGGEDSQLSADGVRVSCFG